MKKESKHVIVLAISAAKDGREMKCTIEDYAADQEHEGPIKVTVVTQLHEIEGLRVDEWVMTPEFGNQRSIRLMDAAMRSVVRRKATTAPGFEPLQDGD